MGRREIGEEDVRVIQKSKGSYYVTLPVAIVREFKWKEGQKVVVEKKGPTSRKASEGQRKEIAIKDWEK